MMDKGSAPSIMEVVKPQAVEENFVRVNPLKIKLLDCRVLCKVVEWGNITSGGIMLPMGADNKQALTIMRVVSIGDGRTTDHGVHIDVRVKPGDYVIVGKYAGLEVGTRKAKSEYKILNEVEILGVQGVDEEEKESA